MRLLSLSAALSLFAACSSGNVLPPQQRDEGPGGKEYVASAADTIFDDGDPEGFRLYMPLERPKDAIFPVVVFLHGYQSMSVAYYELWMTHLARTGVVVIFPMYMDRDSTPDVFLRNIIKGLERALQRIHDEGIAIDETKVAYAGHSGGA